MKKLFFLFFLLPLLTSCQAINTFDPSSVSFCTALALDPSPDGIRLTVETVSAGEGETMGTLYLSATGATLTEAIGKLSESHPGRLQLDTAGVLLLSASLDRAGRVAITDELTAADLLSLRCYVAVAAEGAALLKTPMPDAVAEPCGVYLYRLFTENEPPKGCRLLSLLKDPNRPLPLIGIMEELPSLIAETNSDQAR